MALTGWKTALRRCGVLTAAAAGVWLLLAGPAWWLADSAGLVGLTIASVLCLVPGWLVFLIAASFEEGTAPLIVSVGGMLLRLLFVLVGALVTQGVRPELGFREFFIWLLACYLAMLLTETLLILRPDEPSTNG